MENKDLVLKIKASNREAFDILYGMYHAPLTAYARLFLQGSWAEDIVQDVFVKTWLSRETLDPEKSIYGFLMRSVYNLSINHIKRNKHGEKYKNYYQERIESLSSSFYNPDSNPVIQKMYSSDMYKSIEAGIMSLPEKCRKVFILSYIENVPQKEISARLGISLSTVENHIYLALKQLRASLPKKELLIFATLTFLQMVRSFAECYF